MTPRTLGRAVCAAVAFATFPLVTPAAPASAEGCPDIEVIFARGTNEAPGLGFTGGSFHAAVQSAAGGRSVGQYAINYPAADNFNDRLGFAHNVLAGIRDGGNRIRFMADACPNTRLILGGYSQGAVVAHYIVSSQIPSGIDAQYINDIPAPLGDGLLSHVGAVALFGNPSAQWANEVGAPIPVVDGNIASRTIALCNGGDNVCDGSPVGAPGLMHSVYAINGATGQAAGFAMSRL